MMAYEKSGQVNELTWGALAMAKALYQYSRYPLLLLSNTTAFPDGKSLAEVFGRLGARVLPVYEVNLPSSSAWSVEHWTLAFWKLQIWRLTTFEKLIWLDSDAILYRSIDWIFERTGMWAQRDAWFCDLDAKSVCSGIMMLYPSQEDYEGLLKHFQAVGPQVTHGDQQLIELYFTNVKKWGVNLLSPLEASFGQCIGTAMSPFIQAGKPPLQGIWNFPAFVHKSGGWGDTVSNGYNNVCFIHDVARQRYVVGRQAINVCHFHPLASHWRKLFCGAVAGAGLRIPTAVQFCNDHCYYNGEGPGDAECPQSTAVLSGPLEVDHGRIQGLGATRGVPAPKMVWMVAPYSFKQGHSGGSVQSAIVYHNAVLPAPPYTVIANFRTTVNSECQEIIGWFGPGGASAELRVVWGNLLYGEMVGGWRFIQTQKQSLNNGEWHEVAVVRRVTGEVLIYVSGSLVATGHLTAQGPIGVSPEPKSSRLWDCALNGDVEEFGVFRFNVKPEVLTEIAF